MGKKKGSSEILVPEWNTTLGDAMALMLTFFVMLFTFSTDKEQMLGEALSLMKGGPAIMDPNQAVLPYDAASTSDTKPGVPETDIVQGERILETRIDKKRSKSGSERLKEAWLSNPKWMNEIEKMEERITLEGREHFVDVEKVKEGIRWRLDAEFVFEGNTEKVRANQIIYKVDNFVNLLQRTNNEIRLTMHFQADGNGESENVNWGKALKRAMAMGDFLQKHYDISEKRFGYGVKAQMKGNDKEMIEILLVDRLGTKVISFEDLISERPGQQDND